jgi:thiamine-phosphate pyrophosphorylase
MTMREMYRILDANFNRSREALRVIEDCGRFALNDPAITAMAKHFRSDLKELFEQLPRDELITSRNTPGDLGRDLTSPSEPKRKDLQDVATAACKRLTESLRTIEEYCKIVSPDMALQVERMRYDAYTLEQRLGERFIVGQRFAGVKLYAIITQRFCKHGSVREIARQALAGGADALQIREKEIEDDVLLAMAAELRELTDEMGRLLIVNDRPDIAALVGADGVHLGQHDIPIQEARRLLRTGAIVGKSAHTLDQARQAVTEGADYVAVGPMYATATKPHEPQAGLDLLKQASGEIDIPIVAIGGITTENVSDVVQAGAACICVCSAICAADNPQAAAKTIRATIPEETAD